MNTRNVKSLIDMMEKSSLTALEVEEEGCKIRLERSVQGGAVMQAAPLTPILQQPVLAAPAPQTVPETAPAATPEAPVGQEIKSPMVGVFYASSSPESDPFVTVGQRVKKGDVLCIIEAMKLMNEITAEVEGEITEICAQNGQIIEYGQPLFRIK